MDGSEQFVPENTFLLTANEVIIVFAMVFVNRCPNKYGGGRRMYLMVVTISKYVVLQPKKSFTIKLLKYMYQQSKNIVLHIAFGIENVIIFKRNVDS